MKVLNAGYEILTPISEGGIEELKHIELIARECYKSLDKITDDGESAKKFVKNLIDAGHEAMIEHSTLSVKFMVDRGCCYDKDTKVLTKDGWKLFKDCNLDDEFATLNDSNELCYCKAKSIIVKDYEGIMHHWNTTQVDLLVTPNHNMWVFDYHKRSPETRIWKFIPSQDCTNSRYMMYKSCIPTNEEKKFITIPGCIVHRGFYDKEFPDLKVDANLWLELLGIWVTDGSVSLSNKNYGYRVQITQIKKDVRDRIKYLLDSLKIDYTETSKDFRIKSLQVYHYLVENFIDDKNTRKTYYLHLPNWFRELGKENIKHFLDGVILGDGAKITNSNEHCIYTASKAFAEDLVEMFLLSGKCANIRYVPARNRKFKGQLSESECVPMYYVDSLGTTTHLINKPKMKSPFEEQYNGKIYCVELPQYHKLYVMRNGKAVWCGNSHEIVRHRIASYAQESTRYVNYSKDKYGNEIKVIDILKGIDLDNKMSNLSAATISQIYGEWWSAMEDAEKHYMKMIELGATPQIARSVLPNSTATTLTMTANYREWRAFFKLRTAQGAHPQMREIACALLADLKTKLPIIFDDIE